MEQDYREKAMIGYETTVGNVRRTAVQSPPTIMTIEILRNNVRKTLKLQEDFNPRTLVRDRYDAPESGFGPGF